MYETLLSKIENFEYVFIGIAVVAVIIISLIVYNMVRLHNINKENTEEHNAVLMSIAMNKHNIKTLKKYVDEENTDLESEVTQNKEKSLTNQENIADNLTKINENKSKIHLNKTSLDTEIAQNKAELVDINNKLILQNTKMTGYESSFNTFKNDQDATIKGIKDKHTLLQDKVGIFEYDDFKSLLTNVNSNNVALGNINDGLGNIINDVNTLEIGLDNNLKYVDEEMDAIRKNNIKQQDLTNFFDSSILPKFEEVNSNMRTNYMTNTQLDDRYALSNELLSLSSDLDNVSSRLTTDYMKTNDINDVFAKKADVSRDFAGTRAQMYHQGFKLEDLSNSLTTDYMKTNDINDVFAKKADVSRDFAGTRAQMYHQGFKLEDLSNLLTTDYMTRTQLAESYAPLSDLELVDEESV
jgi:hypothetical protein